MKDFIKEKARFIKVIFECPGMVYTTEKENQLVVILEEIYRRGFESGQIPTESPKTEKMPDVKSEEEIKEIIEEAETEPTEEEASSNNGEASKD